MDANLRAKWVDALRSGDYRQVRNRLQYEGGYCCLGVLCKLADIKINVDCAYPAIAKMIPDWKRLANMNDGDGKSFRQIADYIENNIPAESSEVSDDR